MTNRFCRYCFTEFLWLLQNVTKNVMLLTYVAAVGLVAEEHLVVEGQDGRLADVQGPGDVGRRRVAVPLQTHHLKPNEGR